jgi:hypothetical protein
MIEVVNHVCRYEVISSERKCKARLRLRNFLSSNTQFFNFQPNTILKPSNLFYYHIIYQRMMNRDVDKLSGQKAQNS